MVQEVCVCVCVCVGVGLWCVCVYACVRGHGDVCVGVWRAWVCGCVGVRVRVVCVVCVCVRMSTDALCPHSKCTAVGGTQGAFALVYELCVRTCM